MTKRIFGALFVLLILAALIPAPARASESFAFGEDYSMMCVIDGSTLTISKRGEDSAGEIPTFVRVTFGNSYIVTSPWFEYRNQIETVIIEEGVVNIPTNCFCGMTKMSSVTIPLTMRRIAADGFLYCSALTDIYYAGLPGDWSGIAITAMTSVYNPGTGIFITPTNWLTRAIRHYADGSTGTGSTGGGSTGGNIDPGSGTDGELAFSFERSTGTLTISPGDGVKMTDYDFSGDPAWFKGRNLIKKVVIEDGVTNIGSSAFRECRNLESVELGSTVEKISAYAFRLCVSLKEISIPDSVTEIQEDAFNCCAYMQSITVSEGNPVYTTVDDVLYTRDMTKLIYYPAQRSGESYTVPDTVTEIAGVSFCDAAGLEEIKLPQTIRSIGSYAFEGCGFYEVELPEGLQSLEHALFNRCFQLERVSIPAGVTEINGVPFNRCTALKRIEVDPGNKNYTDEDGVLFTKDGTELLCYPAGKASPSYAVPEGVGSITFRAFRSASCLEAVVLPLSISQVDGDAFEDCDGLTDVYYPGTRDQWDEWNAKNPSSSSVIKSVNEDDGEITAHWEYDGTGLPTAAVKDMETIEDQDSDLAVSVTVRCGEDDASAWLCQFSETGKLIGFDRRALTDGENQLTYAVAEGAVSYRLVVMSKDAEPMCESSDGMVSGHDAES